MNSGCIAIFILFNNKIDNLILFLGNMLGTSNGGGFVNMVISTFAFCADGDGTQ
jgi:hypothetical protein